MTTVFEHIAALGRLDVGDRIAAINEIKQALHAVSPMASEPVDCVLWVPCEAVQANDYNPNAVALYVQESGNVTGYRHITKPGGHTWKSYAGLLLGSLPKNTQEHYLKRFRVFIKWWRKRGYPEGIPDECPRELENKGLAPSYRRICKVLLRNDYWCKGLKFSQPKSDVYKAFVKQKKAERKKDGLQPEGSNQDSD